MNRFRTTFAITFSFYFFMMAAVVFTNAVTGPVEIRSETEVSREDDWMASKWEHQTENDFFSMVRAAWPLDGSEGIYAGSGPYYLLELIVWGMVLPVGMFALLGWIGSAYFTVSWRVAIGSLLATFAGILALGSKGILWTYGLAWDAVIHWCNWLDVSFYHMNVFLFIFLPIASAVGGAAWAVGRAASGLWRRLR